VLHMMVMGACVFCETSAPLQASNIGIIENPAGGSERASGPIVAEVERLVPSALLK